MTLLAWFQNSIIDMFVNMDWKQFVPSLLATIVGIFLPFFIQARIEKSKKKKSALDMIEQIKKELKRIVSDMEGLKENRRYIDPIKTPVWTGFNNTNEIALLSLLQTKKKSGKHNNSISSNSDVITNNASGGAGESEGTVVLAVGDTSIVEENEWYTALYSIYGLIDEFNKWWNLYSEQRTAGRTIEQLKDIKESIYSLKEKLCSKSSNEKESIQYVLNILEKI